MSKLSHASIFGKCYGSVVCTSLHAFASAVLRPIRKPDLEGRFREKASEYETRYGHAHTTIAYHGTKPVAAKSIEEEGLRMPGGKGKNANRKTSAGRFW